MNRVGAVCVVGLFAVALATGCVSPRQHLDAPATPAAKEDSAGRQHAFISPARLSEEDVVVRIVSDVTCTGTLVAEDLVLTAHHCVAARDKKGHVLKHDKQPSELNIELGTDYLPWGEVQVKAIVSPDCGYTTPEGDVALLVLSRRLIGVPTVTPRSEAPRKASKERAGEPLVVKGFGRCGTSPDGIKEYRRDSSPIEEVTSGTFEAQASICPGDSGGPVYVSGTHDLIGVVSASVMDADDKTMGRSIFTRLDRWTALFSAAREIADGADPNELPPFRSCDVKH